MDCHPTFGVSLLEKYEPGHRDQAQDPPPRIQLDSQGYERFIPERFLDGKIENNQQLYLTKWEGYSDVHNTWEHYRSFNDMPIFQRFRRQHPELPIPPARHQQR
jgi:hypothetical protein